MAEVEAEENIDPFLDHLPAGIAEEIRSDVALSKDLKEALYAIEDRAKQGESIGWEEVVSTLNAIAERHGHECGIPIPDLELGHYFVAARRSPLAWTHLANQHRTEHEQELALDNIKTRNSWEVMGDHTVTVVDTEEGPMWIKRPYAGVRLRKLMDGAILRASLPNLTADAELKAMETLKSKINVNQWRCYVLNGVFLERSSRSDLHYLFRKGLPTLAISYHQCKGGKVLAALCLHPIGYYVGTHVGAMTPTDEVIAHLLMMRADERKFWAKSGQWPAWDPRSGI